MVSQLAASMELSTVDLTAAAMVRLRAVKMDAWSAAWKVE